MKAIFGAATTALTPVYNLTRQRYGKSAIAILPSKLSLSDKTKLVLTASVSVIKTHYKKLKPLPIVVVVFDAPVTLTKIRNLHILDINKTIDPLDYEFTSGTFDYAKLFATIEQPSTNTRLIIKNHNIAKNLLAARANGGFVESANSLVYATSILVARQEIRKLIAKFCFAQITERQLQLSLKQHLEMNAARQKMLNSIIKYLHSKKGHALLAACAKLKDNRKNYNKIAAEFQVNKIDLLTLNQWLHLS